MTVKNQDKNISAEDITQLFDIQVEQNNGEITAVKLTRKNFYNDEVGQTYDLMDYFYTEQEIDNFVRIHLVVYDSYAQLPQINKVSSGQSNYIYLVPFIDNGEVKEGIYKEYVWVKIKDSSKYRTGQADHNDYVLNGDHYNYEPLGSTEIDLTQIRQDIATLKQTKLDKSSLTNVLESNNANPVMSKTVYNAISEALDTLNEDSLFLSASTNVIQKNDTITLVAKRYGQQNNSPISFYKGDTLLETVSSQNGMASYTYVGTGAGKTEFTAKSGIIQSETYSLWDTIFHLECTSETSNWNYNNARVSLTFSEDGAYCLGLENTTFKQVTITNNTARFLDGAKNYIIEYDIKKNIPVRLGLIDNGANIRTLLFLGALYTNDWNHIKLVYNADNHTVTPYVNDEGLTPVDLSNYTMTSFGVTFIDNESNQMDFYVKNIKIYYD